MNCVSTVDYFLTNDIGAISSFDVLVIDRDLSDHHPVIITCAYERSDTQNDVPPDKLRGLDSHMVKYLRCDRADLSLYRNMTGLFLLTILSDLIVIESANSATAESIEAIYHSIINSLLSSSKLAVPANTKNYFKFWWDEKLDELKNKSIASCRMWNTAGKPRSGPIFNMYKKDRSAYKNVIRESLSLIHI